MRLILTLLFSLFLFLPAFALDNADVWKPYLQNIEKNVKASWYKASGMSRHNKECKINLFFNVKNTGDVSGVKVLASDCGEDMNKLAIQALNDTAPFPPFPNKISDVKEISIDFIFDYNLLPENRHLQQTNSTFQGHFKEGSSRFLTNSDNSQNTQAVPKKDKQIEKSQIDDNDGNLKFHLFYVMLIFAGLLVLIVICIFKFVIKRK